MKTKKKTGRPPKFSNIKDLKEKGELFFKICEELKKPKTICGLTLALGFKSRESLYEYEKKPHFKDTIKRLRLKCEEYYEERLSGNNPTGAIFALKQFEWKDKQEIESSGGIRVEVINYGTKPKDEASRKGNIPS